MMTSRDEAERLRRDDDADRDDISRRPGMPAAGSVSAVGVIQVGTAANDVQTLSLSGNPTGGTFTLEGYNPISGAHWTVTLPWNATAAQVATALNAPAILGPSPNVACTGGPLPGSPIVVTLGSTLADMPMAPMSGDGSLLTGTGATPGAVAVAHTTTGEGAFPSVAGAFYKVSIGTVRGVEAEGEAGQVVVSRILYAVNLGPSIPVGGQEVLLTWVPYRWSFYF